MILKALGRATDYELAASWLSRKENNQWLDFGNARLGVTPALVRIMAQRDTHLIRLYTADDDDTPIGIAALNNIDRRMRTGMLWAVAGEKRFRNRGYAQVAASRLLTLAFQELGLHSVTTWTVDENASRRAVARLGFRFIGRQRQCHFIDGEPHDRLLFDLLAGEHHEMQLRARAAIGGALVALT